MVRRRLKVFAKGTVEVHDPLLFSRVNGKTAWNGINEVLRERGEVASIRVQHEIGVRFDQLLQASREIPDELSARGLRLGELTLEAQFGTALFATDADAIVLSLLPDIIQRLVVHRTENYTFCAAQAEQWTSPDRAWLLERFSPKPALTPDESMSSLAAVVARIREKRDCPILVFNVSPVIPGEQVHCYIGARQALSIRMRRFNLALIDLATSLPISIIDVDAALARVGTERAKVDAIHYTPVGHRAVAEEVVRVLRGYGLLAPKESDASCL